jgi:hypothetical protein
VEDRLDVVPVRIERVRGVVARVVVALARAAVVRAARRERRLVEARDPSRSAAWKARWAPIVGSPSAET